MKNFFEGKGFYIVLALCVTSIGVAGYVNFSNDDNETLSEQTYEIILPTVDEETTVLAPETTTDTEVKSSYIPSLSVPEIEAEVVIKQEEEPLAPNGNGGHDEITDVKTSKPAEILYISPVENVNVIQENSLDELVKDTTMNDWRTHNATDFVANVGDYILAISNGTVTSIETSDMYGTVIEIAHECGLITKTFGLNSDTTCNVSDNVYAGDVIGTAQGEILFEQKLGEHIHVEAIRDGKNVNIMDLING